MAVLVRRARPEDTDAVHSIITLSAERSGILPRTRDDILSSIDTFLVAETGNTMIGVVSYHNYGPDLKEVRSLSVNREYSRHGIGTLLLKNLVQKIHAESTARIFALSSVPEFFIKNGFRIVERSTLPEKIWKDCDVCPRKDRCTSTALEYTV